MIHVMKRIMATSIILHDRMAFPPDWVSYIGIPKAMHMQAAHKLSHQIAIERLPAFLIVNGGYCTDFKCAYRGPYVPLMAVTTP